MTLGGPIGADVRHFLNGAYLRQFIETQASGTTRKRITGKKLKALPVPVPPSAEQDRIVEKIETLFAQLDKGEEAVREVQKLLTRYRQSVLKSAVTGQLTADWRKERKEKTESGFELLVKGLKLREAHWKGRYKYKEPMPPVAANMPELPAGWSWASPHQLSKPEDNSLCIGPFGSNLKVDDYKTKVFLWFSSGISGLRTSLA